MEDHETGAYDYEETHDGDGSEYDEARAPLPFGLDLTQPLVRILCGERRRKAIGRRSHAQDLPGPGHALQLMHPQRCKGDVLAHHEITHRARATDLGCLRKSHYTGRGVHRNAARASLDRPQLACVKTTSHVDPDRLDIGDDRGGTSNGNRGLGERCEEPVARGVFLATIVALQIRAHDAAELREGNAPALVTELCRQRSGADDVKEQHRRYARRPRAPRHATSIDPVRRCAISTHHPRVIACGGGTPVHHAVKLG